MNWLTYEESNCIYFLQPFATQNMTLLVHFLQKALIPCLTLNIQNNASSECMFVKCTNSLLYTEY